MIYIFDIDGTIADLTHRLHHIQKTPKDWSGFFQDCADDEPIPEVVEVAAALNSRLNTIILITGRSDEIRDKTEKWLVEKGVHYGWLLMRKAGDHREDNVVKSELLDELLSKTGMKESNIAGVFEDRQQVVKMYRDRGLRVFQVAPGQF